MKKYYAEFMNALEENKLVVVYRKKVDGYRLDGYVIGLSNTWVLLHLIDGNVVVPNGYKAIRLAHVSQIKVDEGFVDGYLRLRGMRSESLPWIRLNDLSSLLFSVSENYPLFMIETECKEPGIGFVGRIEKLTKRNIWLEKIKSTTEWIGVEKFKLKDITCVDFGDGYVEALAWVDAYQQEAQPSQ